MTLELAQRVSRKLAEAGFSVATASGSYTARRPRCSIRYGNPKSCPNFGSSST